MRPLVLHAPEPVRLRRIADRLTERPGDAWAAASLNEDGTLSRFEMRIDAATWGVAFGRTWLPDDLSPRGVSAALRLLLSDVRPGMDIDQRHGPTVARHAIAALLVCEHLGTLPDLKTEEDGATRVEYCLDDDMKPIYWVSLADQEEASRRLEPDPDLMLALAGEPPIPLHAWNDAQPMTIMVTPSCSDSEGVGVLLRRDPVETLRTHARLAAILAKRAA